MSGTLFVVATPIGNLEDITLRALRVLREVDLIAAEDTRRTARLLAAHAIRTPTTSFHAHNARARTPLVIDRLLAGGSVALVTDAGTPGISDPGSELVRACVDQGVAVDVLPGPSAAVAAAVMSGFDLTRLDIRGFVPRNVMARKHFLEAIGAASSTAVVFEAPHRVVACVEEMRRCFGNRQICVVRELTKAHQEVIRGTPDTVLPRLKARGEFTIVLASVEAHDVPSAVNQTDPLTERQIFDEFVQMPDSVGSRRTRIAKLAARLGRSTRDVYAAVERVKAASRDDGAGS